MTDTQCSSCGGFCGKGGCEREDVKPNHVETPVLAEFIRAIEAKQKEKNRG